MWGRCFLLDIHLWHPHSMDHWQSCTSCLWMDFQNPTWKCSLPNWRSLNHLFHPQLPRVWRVMKNPNWINLLIRIQLGLIVVEFSLLVRLFCFYRINLPNPILIWIPSSPSLEPLPISRPKLVSVYAISSSHQFIEILGFSSSFDPTSFLSFPSQPPLLCIFWGFSEFEHPFCVWSLFWEIYLSLREFACF